MNWVIKMNKVVSLRLDQRQVSIIKNLEKTEKDKSAAARELIDNGWKFMVLRLYRKGKISAGSAARELGMPLADFIEMLKDF